MKALLALPLLALVSNADPQTATQCPAPTPVPQSVTTPNSTYYSAGEPPQRFAHAPTKPIRVLFGEDAIKQMCGVPPCHMRFVACTSADGATLALPDPFTTDGASFAATVRHELGHVNGWPATHGD